MEAKAQNTILRSIPSVTELLQHSAIQDVLGIFPRQLVLAAIRSELESLRSEILSNNAPFPSSPGGDLATIVSRIRAHLQKASGFSLQKVINATGIVIHTNLGRAPLPPQVLENLAEVAEGYCNLEYDLEKGERGSRYRHVEETLLDLTGAESGLVVNNNAAAVLIVLNTVAQGREVIVSRGELIEIGGSFRLPDVMRQSGCLLKEVGATNRTRISDYEEALTSQTGLLMSVHPSNFRIVGFTEQVGLRELVALGRKHGIPVMNDLGSGTLVDLSRYGLEHEPTVPETIAAGADIVTFSGDKLLGGPQAGIIIGRRQFIEPIKQNPLLRAVRVDKFTVAALEVVLKEYHDPEKAAATLPVLRMLSLPADDIRKKAVRLRRLIRKRAADAYDARSEKDYSQAGGGSLPLQQIPTWVVALISRKYSVAELDRRLRKYTPPIVGRIRKDTLVLDLRTVFDQEIPVIAEALESLV